MLDANEGAGFLPQGIPFGRVLQASGLSEVGPPVAVRGWVRDLRGGKAPVFCGLCVAKRSGRQLRGVRYSQEKVGFV